MEKMLWIPNNILINDFEHNTFEFLQNHIEYSFLAPVYRPTEGGNLFG